MSFELGYLNDDEIKFLSKETGLSIPQIEEAQKVYVQTQIVSLDAPINKSSEDSLRGVLASDTLNPEQEAFLNERNSELLKIIQTSLKPREAKVVMLRFGLETGSAMTLEEVGKLYGLTRERIRQIEAKALTKLRRKIGKNEKDIWLME